MPDSIVSSYTTCSTTTNSN